MGKARSITVGALAALALPATAQAASWSAGEGPGRAGLQPIGGNPPLEPLYRLDVPAGGRVATPLLLTNPGKDGRPPRLAFGTSDGVVHLFDALDGKRVGPADGILVNGGGVDHSFTGYGGTIAMLDSSTPEKGLGQLFVVHDELDQYDGIRKRATTDDVGIAQIDQESGQLVVDVPLTGTNGYRVSAAPVLGDPTGEKADRQLVVGMIDKEDWEKRYETPQIEDPIFGPSDDPEAATAPLLKRVPIGNSGTIAAQTGYAAPQNQAQPLLNPLAPLTMAYIGPIPEPSAAPVDPVPRVLIPTADPEAPIKSRNMAALNTAGPSSQRLDKDAKKTDIDMPMAVSVPVASTGLPPGAKNSKAARADQLIVATYRRKLDRTTVRRLTVNRAGNGMVETVRSAAISGRPGTQLATSGVTGRPGASQGVVVIGTSTGLHGLRGSDLKQLWQIGGSFRTTAPAIVGDTVLAPRDTGEPVVVDALTGRALGPDRFRPHPDHAGAPAPGSPAVANGIVVWATVNGVFGYRVTCGNVLRGTDGNEAIEGSAAGDDVTALDGSDTVTAFAGNDCVTLGGGDDVADLGAGDDRVEGASGRDRVLAGSGDDVADGGLGEDQLNGDDGNDRLAGGAERDVLKGGNGNDEVDGGGGNDTMKGDGDQDRLIGGEGRDRIKGGNGDDALEGGEGNDRLDGGNGRDALVGGIGRDVLVGGADADTIEAADGARDTVICGPGLDRVNADRFDRVSPSCEAVMRPKATSRPKRKRRPSNRRGR